MKQKIKIILLTFFLISTVGITWVTTGHNTESGWLGCGGGFYPNYSLPANNPGGPCLSSPTTQTVSGRYQDSGIFVFWVAIFGGSSLLGYLLLVLEQHKPKFFRNPYFCFLLLPIFLGILGSLFDFFVINFLSYNLQQNYLNSHRLYDSFFLGLLNNLAIVPAVILLLIGLVRGTKNKKPILVALILLFFVILGFVTYVYTSSNVF